MAQYYRAPSASTAVKPLPSADCSELPDTDLHRGRLPQARSGMPAVNHIGRPPIQTLKANRSASSISSVDTSPASAELSQGSSAEQKQLHSNEGHVAGLCATAFQPISSALAGRQKSSQRSADSAHNMETLKQLGANDTAFTAEVEAQVIQFFFSTTKS